MRLVLEEKSKNLDMLQYPIESPNTGMIYKSSIRRIGDVFSLEYQKHGEKCPVLYDGKPLEEIEKAKEVAHRKAIDLVTEMMAMYLQPNSEVKIIDKTPRGKQLEIKLDED